MTKCDEQLRFDRQVAIVTGAGRGLGREHALLLAKRGASVVVNDVGMIADGKSLADLVVEEICAVGGSAVADRNSVATAAGGVAIVQTALNAFGQVDVIVNNAGILRSRMLHKMSSEEFDDVIDVHLRGAFHVVRPALALMRERRYGRIVSTTSGAAIFGRVGAANYCAAKAGLIGFTRGLAMEGAHCDIAANLIAPIAETDMTGALAASAGADGAHNSRLDEGLRALAPRLTTTAVSPLVAYLAHPSCAANGQIFTVAGGRVAEVFIAEGRGLVQDDLTPESIAANWNAVINHEEYLVPRDMSDEIDIYRRLLSPPSELEAQEAATI